MVATVADGPNVHVDADGRYEPYDYWHETCGIYDLYAQARDLMGDVAGKTILDCGCGPGNTAIMLARRGARVSAFDVDEDTVEHARSVVAANGVDVALSCRDFEELDFADGTFDYLFGSFVIHHVDVDRASHHIDRLLKPGGRAVFIENSARNPLLMLARRFLVGSFGIPKYGDDDEEHPLTDREIEKLRSKFKGTLHIHLPHLVLFRLLDFYIVRARIRWLSGLLRGLDNALGRVRWIRRFGYFQIIEFRKPD